MLVLVDGVRLNDVAVGPPQRRHPRAARRGGADRGAVRARGLAVRRRRLRRHRQRHHPRDGPLHRCVSWAALTAWRAAARQWGAGDGRASHVLAASSDRSGGFMYDRDFVPRRRGRRRRFGDSTRVSASWLRKEFGANNFYGGNAPSREWTNQTLLSLNHRIRRAAGWAFAAARVRTAPTATASSSTRRGPSCRTTVIEPMPRSATLTATPAHAWRLAHGRDRGGPGLDSLDEPRATTSCRG